MSKRTLITMWIPLVVAIAFQVYGIKNHNSVVFNLATFVLFPLSTVACILAVRYRQARDNQQ